jgi:hypothetical protein
MRYSNPPFSPFFLFHFDWSVKMPRSNVTHFWSSLLLLCLCGKWCVGLALFYGITVFLFFSSFLLVNVTCTRSALWVETVHYPSPHLISTPDAERLESGGTDDCWNWGERAQMKGVAADTRDFCSALAGLVGPVQNTFFLTLPYLLSISVCLCPNLTSETLPPRPSAQHGQNYLPVSLPLFFFVLGFLNNLWGGGGIGLSYRPARLHRLAESIPWWACQILNTDSVLIIEPVLFQPSRGGSFLTVVSGFHIVTGVVVVVIWDVKATFLSLCINLK